MSRRRKIIEELVDVIVTIERPHPIRVAIDGVDAAGKTILADEMTPIIEERGRAVIRASIDGFHNPKSIRYRQGADSPRGYYQDSFNYEAVIKMLLIPLGPGGNRKHHRRVFDYRADAPTPEPPSAAPLDAVLLFDGVFLLRPELVAYWDFHIFIDVDFEISVPRAVRRDLRNGLGSAEEAIYARYQQRYVPGQRLYFEDARPKEHADVILDNNQIDSPMIISRSDEK